MAIVETVGVTKDYHVNGLVVNALRGIDLSIDSGEFVAIAGPSGSGKSTLLHLIGCLDGATSGSISIDGQDVAKLDRTRLAFLRREKIGFIFQAYNLIPVLSAIENVSLPLALLGAGRYEARELAAAALADVGLAGMEKRKPKELSGGQQQRIAIARSLVKRPRLILADEPTANLDSKTGREVLELMLALNAEAGTTFVFSTHDRMVMDFARRLVLLHDGAISEEIVK